MPQNLLGSFYTADPQGADPVGQFLGQRRAENQEVRLNKATNINEDRESRLEKERIEKNRQAIQDRADRLEKEDLEATIRLVEKGLTDPKDYEAVNKKIKDKYGVGVKDPNMLRDAIVKSKKLSDERRSGKITEKEFQKGMEGLYEDMGDEDTISKLKSENARKRTDELFDVITPLVTAQKGSIIDFAKTDELHGKLVEEFIKSASESNDEKHNEIAEKLRNDMLGMDDKGSGSQSRVKDLRDWIDVAMPLAGEKEKLDKYQEIQSETTAEANAKASGKVSVKDLPDLRSKANKAFNGKKRINQMLGLLDKGVTGKPGEFKKAIAGWLEFFPIVAKEEIEDYSNAQLFHLLGRMMTGPMRLDIIGPGPVTEYEQTLWNTMSGGGGAAEPAVRELLTNYSNIADESVSFYNESRDAASQGNPSVKLQFQRIGEKTTGKEGLREKYDY